MGSTWTSTSSEHRIPDDLKVLGHWRTSGRNEILSQRFRAARMMPFLMVRWRSVVVPSAIFQCAWFGFQECWFSGGLIPANSCEQVTTWGCARQYGKSIACLNATWLSPSWSSSRQCASDNVIPGIISWNWNCSESFWGDVGGGREVWCFSEAMCSHFNWKCCLKQLRRSCWKSTRERERERRRLLIMYKVVTASP